MPVLPGFASSGFAGRNDATYSAMESSKERTQEATANGTKSSYKVEMSIQPVVVRGRYCYNRAPERGVAVQDVL